jgi:hypothetical protein
MLAMTPLLLTLYHICIANVLTRAISFCFLSTRCNNSPADFTNPCFAIQPVRQRPCIRLIRSAARCPINGFKLLPREQINVNTAYIDGSMIYGSSESVAKSVRDFNNGSKYYLNVLV